MIRCKDCGVELIPDMHEPTMPLCYACWANRASQYLADPPAQRPEQRLAIPAPPAKPLVN